VLAIVGPTGTGKTEVAAELARRSGAEIISVDSMQVYRGLDIGTAKPGATLRREIPHHLIDVVDPDDPMSAGRFAGLAREAADAIHARGRRVILCGGTGLYARAFAGGLIDEAESDPALRAELEARDTADLLGELRRTDPEAAARIPPADRMRLVRALEVLRLGGEPISRRHACHGFGDRPFELCWFGLDLERERLAERIRERVGRMLEAGWVEEVRALHERGYGPELRSLQAIGYREIGWLLAGGIDLAQARDAISLATRRYAKRQRTWFRAEPGLEWLDAAQPELAVEAALRKFDWP
jgi:tRNA dimethylallyltransferase